MASVIRIGNVRKAKLTGTTSLESLVEQGMVAKLRRKDSAAQDLLHQAIRANPKTGKVIEASLSAVTIPANEYLADMLEAMARTLNNESSFSSTVTTSGNKRVNIARGKYGSSGIPGQVVGTNWSRLRPSYLKRIGVTGTSRRPGAGDTKRWWYERKRTGSRSSDTGSASTGEEAVSNLSQLAASIGSFGSKNISKAGWANKFSIGPGVKRGRTRTHLRTAVKGNKFLVYGVKGVLQGPTRLDLNHQLDLVLSDITLTALMSSTEQRVGAAAKTLYNAAGRDDWLANILANESRRPWISKFFAQGGKSGLTRHIQDHLRTEV